MIRERGNLMKLEEQNLDIEVEEIDLIELLNTVRFRLASLSSSRKVDFSVHYCGTSLDEAPPFLINGDRDLLKRALENLAKNAIEASPEGAQMLIQLEENAGRLGIDIHNVGVIPERIRDTLFQNYTTSKGESGHGIGVYLSNLIILTHNGNITFRTNEEEGTHLMINMPIKQEEKA